MVQQWSLLLLSLSFSTPIDTMLHNKYSRKHSGRKEDRWVRDERWLSFSTPIDTTIRRRRNHKQLDQTADKWVEQQWSLFLILNDMKYRSKYNRTDWDRTEGSSAWMKELSFLIPVDMMN